MRIIIAASGSGGHLFCGLGIAEAFRLRIPDISVFFLGSGDKLVRRLVEGSGFEFYKIYASRFKLSQITSIIQSGLLFLYLRPKIVISTGGFVSIGIVFWSWIFRTPCVIHEQNLVPGEANRLARYAADKVLVSFEGTQGYFGRKSCIVTGMPTKYRQKLPVNEARSALALNLEQFTVLIIGGSKGAHTINQIVISILDKLPRDLQFIHLTGNKDLGQVREAYRRKGFRAYVENFSIKMEIIYSASNLVIGRAGSGTLSEITFFGLPSILIPYPYSKDRHQYRNAEYLEKKGAAVVIPEEDMDINKVVELVKSRDRLQEMADNSIKLAKPDAVDRIIDEVMELIHA